MPSTPFKIPEKYSHNAGFGSMFESEAIPNALPVACNSPQKHPLGLYTEKLSGTAFTAPRHSNLQSWLYRILPSAAHPSYTPHHSANAPDQPSQLPPTWLHIPNQLRWSPFDIDPAVDFVCGMKLLAGAGDPAVKNGLCIYIYGASKDMDNHAFYNADGDFLVVPQQGTLDIQTELGNLLVRENEICVLPRGLKWRISLPNGPVRGYILEICTVNHFELPDLGPIGSNCLANARDFLAPVAAFDKDMSPWKITAKFNHNLFSAIQNHTPFDVVAWHGNYYPYKYDLGRFNTIGSVSFDHPDPSIFTVLTCKSAFPGTAIADFVIFPPRWLVQEDTFRPPWYHRNTMSEFMGLLGGVYDAKTGGGFQPGGASLHNVFSAHGPDAESYEKAINAHLEPQKVGVGSMAFMFESQYMIGVTKWALTACSKLQDDYNEHWQQLKPHFLIDNPSQTTDSK
ncbi:Homogentisate 1,2-dioxygenase [Neolecta irregularis DAH-3]|uniref:homogentisate 1,2-dioxygenase n=1 Tax=Neolecta irregularis (strain DAH-3) TaxID=1198029 RepID=A0A1U7LG55_NEOID|nr:Homogentisate 1,2-dioxygenase [Neolecta irregularis DAH-3]|eukprot:OLL21627.1 Homogentisate 1,2-dioxygenase [Neolecta irregularis DAH-3]